MEQTHEHTPITGNLRQAMVQWGWADGREVTFTNLQPSIDAEPFLTIRGGRFGELCDAIDAVHAGLERENAELKAELEEAEHRGWTRGYDEGFASADDWLGQHEDAMAEHGWVRKNKEHVISHAAVEVTPHIDWSRMADELDEFVEIVRGIAGGAE